MKLSEQYAQLRSKVLAQLTEIVLANQEPFDFLDGKDAIAVSISNIRFLRVANGELKAINISRYYVDIGSIPLFELIKFIESYKPA